MELKKIDTNRLFSEFLGWKINKNGDVKIPQHLYVPYKSYEIESGMYEYQTDLFDLEFTTNYNWVMEVVDKIENLNHISDFGFIIKKGEVYLQHAHIFSVNEVFFMKRVHYDKSFDSIKTKLDAIIKVSIHFIQWYNENLENIKIK